MISRTKLTKEVCVLKEGMSALVTEQFWFCRLFLSWFLKIFCFQEYCSYKQHFNKHFILFITTSLTSIAVSFQKNTRNGGLQINFGTTEYLTLDLAAGIVTETVQIKAVNKFRYLGSILEASGATTLETGKRISEGRRVLGMLNSVLWSKTILHKTKKNLCTRL
jgi:hypothetical protein